MFALTRKQWAVILVGGVAAGLLVSALLPHPPIVFHHAARRGGPLPPSPVQWVSYLPWILVFAGVALGSFNRNNTAFLTFAGTIVTAGATLLARSS